MSGLAEQAAFYGLALLMVVSGFKVVTTRNILHAGYWLLPCFASIAGLFALLAAHFFFVVQLLIYAGAILVLFIFAVMLTRNVMHPRRAQTNTLAPWAGLVCAAMLAGMGAIAAGYGWRTTSALPAEPAHQTAALGAALIGLYAVPFEVSSLLLLAALIGAVVLAKSERDDVPEEPPLALVEEGLAAEPSSPDVSPAGVH
ncbi:MAG: NADH-quinone oxidoreductase subunit J family protein [Chthonomonadales bacterium]